MYIVYNVMSGSWSIRNQAGVRAQVWRFQETNSFD